MTHTPTPWQTGGWSHDDDAAVVHAGGAKFAQALYLGGTDQAKANADRIVACVNFFHGKDIPTERLEEGGFWKLIDWLQASIITGVTNEQEDEIRALLAKLGVEPNEDRR